MHVHVHVHLHVHVHVYLRALKQEKVLHLSSSSQRVHVLEALNQEQASKLEQVDAHMLEMEVTVTYLCAVCRSFRRYSYCANERTCLDERSIFVIWLVLHSALSVSEYHDHFFVHRQRLLN